MSKLDWDLASRRERARKAGPTSQQKLLERQANRLLAAPPQLAANRHHAKANRRVRPHPAPASPGEVHFVLVG